MKNIKFGMKIGIIAWAAISTYEFCTALERVLLKRALKKIDKLSEKIKGEAQDAEKKEPSAEEDFEDFLR